MLANQVRKLAPNRPTSFDVSSIASRQAPRLLALVAACGFCFFLSAPHSILAQEGEQKSDPASTSDIIEKTLAKIREVDKLDNYIQENATLKNQNKSLQQQIAALTKQVNKLTQDLSVQNERMRRQLLELPSFALKSKIIGTSMSMALLQHKDKTLKIREGMSMNVLVKDGVYVLMKVEEISKDLVVLSFPELDKKITFYD